MIYSGIIWNTAYSHHKEILDDISREYKLVNTKIFNLKDNHRDFIIDVYLDDNITAWGWKLDKKIECMEAFDEKKAVAFEIEIDNPSFVFVERKNKSVCKEAEDLKAKIRDKYSKIITPYFYDTVLHMSDDLQQTLQLKKTLHKYKDYIEKEDVFEGNKRKISPVIGTLNSRSKDNDISR